MKPGVTSFPSPLITRAPGDSLTSLDTSALEPTRMIRSPLIATPVAHGWRGFPVQMRAFTIASVIELAEVIGFVKLEVMKESSATTTPVMLCMVSFGMGTG